MCGALAQHVRGLGTFVEEELRTLLLTSFLDKDDGDFI